MAVANGCNVSVGDGHVDHLALLVTHRPAFAFCLGSLNARPTKRHRVTIHFRRHVAAVLTDCPVIHAIHSLELAQHVARLNLSKVELPIRWLWCPRSDLNPPASLLSVANHDPCHFSGHGCVLICFSGVAGNPSIIKLNYVAFLNPRQRLTFLLKLYPR